jgi:uncharacterized protein (TIGR03437 family)
MSLNIVIGLKRLLAGVAGLAALAIASPLVAADMKVFLQGNNLVDPRGIAIGSDGSIFVHMAGHSANLFAFPEVVVKYGADGKVIWSAATPDGLSCKLDRDPSTNAIWALCGSRLLTVDPQTGRTAAIADLATLTFDQSNIFDAAQAQAQYPIRNIVSISPTQARFGDLALYRSGTNLYAFVTARWFMRDYVIRLRFASLAPVNIAEARVIMSSGASDLVASTDPYAPAKGIAVSANGMVGAMLPVYDPIYLNAYADPFGPSLLMAFPATFDPANPGNYPIFTTYKVSGPGMAADAAGGYYVAANGPSYATVCTGASSNGVVRIAPDLRSVACFGISSLFIAPFDVAVDNVHGTGYATAQDWLLLDSFVYSFSLPPGSGTAPPTAGITADGITNASSFSSGPVAPGELVTIFGKGFGPATLVQAGYDAAGMLPTTIGQTSVYFNGLAAPMVYTLDGQVSAIVPYGVSGNATVQVEYNGTRTNSVTLAVANAAPGIFTYSGGSGQAVVVNYNNGATSFNSAEVPALRGSPISFYITGEGRLNRSWSDGRLPWGPDFPAPAQDVTVAIGGVNAPVLFKGLVYCGVTQINATVPANAPVGGKVGLAVNIGGVVSQANVTLAIR